MIHFPNPNCTVKFSRPVVQSASARGTRFKECAEQNKPIQYIKTRNKATEISRKKAENSMLALIDEMKERGTL